MLKRPGDSIFSPSERALSLAASHDRALPPQRRDVANVMDEEGLEKKGNVLGWFYVPPGYGVDLLPLHLFTSQLTSACGGCEGKKRD